MGEKEIIKEHSKFSLLEIKILFRLIRGWCFVSKRLSDLLIQKGREALT